MALEPLRSDEIRLQAGGAGWMGTFGMTASFMINDILSDGLPIDNVTLVFEDDRDKALVVQGRVTEWTVTEVTFDDGAVLDLSDDLLAVTL
jgi:hypothetical protein